VDGLALRHTEVQLHLEQLRHELVLIEVPVAVEVDAREEVKQPLAALGEGGAHARRDLAGRGDADRLVHGVQPPPPRVARDSRALERGEVGVEVGVELGRGGAVRGVPALHRHLVLITDRLSCRREIFVECSEEVGINRLLDHEHQYFGAALQRLAASNRPAADHVAPGIHPAVCPSTETEPTSDYSQDTCTAAR